MVAWRQFPIVFDFVFVEQRHEFFESHGFTRSSNDLYVRKLSPLR